MNHEGRGTRRPEPSGAELLALEAVLAASLRSDCPSPQTLGEHRLGLSTGPEQARIARHLSTCPHCREELELLERFLERSDETPEPPAADLSSSRAPGAPGSFKERLFQWTDALASLLGPQTAGRAGISGPAMPVPAGVRGAPGRRMAPGGASPSHEGGAALGLTFASDEAMVALQARPAPHGRFDLLVLVAPVEGSPGDLPVWLRHEGDIVASARTDPAGNAVLAGLAAGAYDLAVQHAAARIWVKGIRLGPSTDSARGDADAPTP
ncbi:hypothetical protein [Limnochorda pilosa]|uniref:Zinc-finger domain-containing protein n=1 Tax=Limnochorda pilosa TaxID=1555112 RepID=A0A0K2SJM8_LIMPI|nr:hypothetical protein [Limnochorda pilosa]BAS27318.1 hypothetical protein LIP_1469 [Limnochorda pilosa]